MTEFRVAPDHQLMVDMDLSDVNIERRKRFVDLQPEDVAHIAEIRDLVVSNVDDFVAAFLGYLKGVDEAAQLFASPALTDQARQLKRAHLIAMVGGNYGTGYVTQRLQLALLYSQVELDRAVFLGGFHHLLKMIGDRIVDGYPGGPVEGFKRFMSLKKVAFFDISLVVDALVFERERVIRQQADAIRELSTPVLQIRDRLLLLPLVGMIDTYRARLITNSLLQSIRATRSKAVVMDVTGVATMDSRVANHLLQTVAAAKLMGATVIVTGLSSEVAQSLVGLGIDLSRVITVGDLQGGLEEAERLLVQAPAPSPVSGASRPLA